VGLIVAAIAASTAIGVWSQRRYGNGALALSRSALLFTLWCVLPPVTFINLVEADFHGDAWLGIVGGLASVTLLGFCAWFTGTRILRIARPSTGALMCSVVVPNTGYLGYPVVAALLGFDALGEAVAYDVLVAGPMMIVGSFAIGAAFGDHVGAQERVDTRERVMAFFTRNPLVITAILALTAPDLAIPEAIVDLSRVLVMALLPIGFFTVGVALADSASQQGDMSPMRRDRAVIAAVALRIVGGPLLLYAITAPFIDLPGTYLLLSAMPCGVGTMMVAYAYGLDARLAARAIAWSTLISVVCFAAGSLVL
jgi:predicted permease